MGGGARAHMAREPPWAAFVVCRRPRKLSSYIVSCPLLLSPQAVGADERLRAFFADDSLSTGLLFRCKDANVGLEAPLGE